MWFHATEIGLIKLRLNGPLNSIADYTYTSYTPKIGQ